MIPLALVAALLAAATDPGSGLYESKHDFSLTGRGELKAQSERRACVFCHAAHTGRPGGLNRKESAAPFQSYRSATMASRPSTGPNGASRICLSCHDGTIAIGDTVRGKIAMRTVGSGKTTGSANLGFDLSTSHPVSFQVSPSAKARRPGTGEKTSLDRAGQVQCTSCHDPHVEDADPVQKKFLVTSSRNGALCTGCHQLPGWQANPSAHQASFARTDVPGSTLLFSTVAENACASCHVSHRGGAALVNAARGESEDKVCLACHDGRIAKTDLTREVTKPYAHAILGGPTGHVPGEGPNEPTARLPEKSMAQPRHVACVDCHEPHSAFSRRATAPRAAGSLAGVWGIDRYGMRVQPVSYEYEVCFKCHADSVNQPQARGAVGTGTVRRAVPDVNLRRVFGADAASSHPVLGPGGNPNVPGLLGSMNAGTVLYCSDCHASSAAARGLGAPRGPHGSTIEHLLERDYSTADGVGGSYALCSKCHDPSTLLSGDAVKGTLFASTSGGVRKSLHDRHLHLTAGGPAACAACHNAHGVSSIAGSRTSNAHLIDFDVNVVKPNAKGLRQYNSLAPGSGTCALSCHGKDHDALPYGY